MNLKHLRNEEVLSGTEKRAENLRRETTELLYYLCEVSARELYAVRGCSSLFSYCVEILKFSESEAACRISAARALREFPEVAAKIDSGVLTLTTVSKAQRFFKKENKSAQEKKQILLEIESKSSREVDMILAPSNPDEIKDRVHVVSSEITEIRFGANQELMDDLERLKEIWGGLSLAELVQKMAKVALKHCDPVLKAKRAKTRVTFSEKGRNRYIQSSVRHSVWNRDQGTCNYIGKNGKRCGAKFLVQMDHQIPYALGGPNTVKNMRLCCPAHNKLHAKEWGLDLY